LKIDIYQRYPILRILGLSGNYYVDKEGVVMPVNYNFSAYVPVASGYISKEYATSALLKFAVFLQDNKFWDAQIDQIYVTADGDVELIPRVGKQTIILGTLSDFEKKLDNLYAFYQKGQNKKGWNVYQAISLKYENQIIGIK
jgi:Cell division protein FtsQ.